MTWAPAETQSAIFTALRNDGSLSSLIGQDSTVQKVFDHVPQGTNYPFVVMQINPWEDRGNHTGEGLSAVLTMHVWYQPGAGSNTGRGDKQTQLIQKRIDELIHKGQFQISGWRIVCCRRITVDIIPEPDNVTRHGVQQFKLFLGGN